MRTSHQHCSFNHQNRSIHKKHETVRAVVELPRFENHERFSRFISTLLKKLKNKIKYFLEANSTLSRWLKPQPLRDAVKHWKYWDPIISISLALSLVCYLSITFLLNLLLFLSLSCFPASTPSRCCINRFKKTKER